MDPKIVLIPVISVGAVATNEDDEVAAEDDGPCNAETRETPVSVDASEEVVFDEAVISCFAVEPVVEMSKELTVDVETWVTVFILSDLPEEGDIIVVASIESQEGSFPGMSGSSSEILDVTAIEALLAPRDVMVGEGTFLNPAAVFIAVDATDSGIC
jgi:hypothetical protein